MPRPAPPSLPLSRAGFVRPGEVCAEANAGVSAWLVRIAAGSHAASGASAGATAAGAAGAGFALAPAGTGFVPAA